MIRQQLNTADGSSDMERRRGRPQKRVHFSTCTALLRPRPSRCPRRFVASAGRSPSQGSSLASPASPEPPSFDLYSTTSDQLWRPNNGAAAVSSKLCRPRWQGLTNRVPRTPDGGREHAGLEAENPRPCARVAGGPSASVPALTCRCAAANKDEMSVLRRGASAGGRSGVVKAWRRSRR